MITVKLLDRQGATHQVVVPVNVSLMQAVKDQGYDIPAICAGSCSCATCHVYIDDEWSSKLEERGIVEEDLLMDLSAYDSERSRLACQIKLEASLDGLSFALAPITF